VEQLDDLAIDAIHMLAFVDTDPLDQLKWGQAALTIVEASTQPAAKKWEASLRNNIGYALYQLRRYDEVLAQFKQSVVLREEQMDAEATRTAYWMVAWTLRVLNWLDETLEIQLRLEQECAQASVPDPFVYEELGNLYQAMGDDARAGQYAEKRKQALEQGE
jgi:tetratricopeptide (TPR) repeat protein